MQSVENVQNTFYAKVAQDMTRDTQKGPKLPKSRTYKQKRMTLPKSKKKIDITNTARNEITKELPGRLCGSPGR